MCSRDSTTCVGRTLLISIILVYFCTADIDECSSGTHNCHKNAECLNEIGSFSCRCSDGYSGDGFSCEGENRLWVETVCTTECFALW